MKVTVTFEQPDTTYETQDYWTILTPTYDLLRAVYLDTSPFGPVLVLKNEYVIEKEALGYANECITLIKKEYQKFFTRMIKDYNLHCLETIKVPWIKDGTQ